MQQRRRPMRWMMLAGLGAMCGLLAVLVLPMLGNGAAESTPSQSSPAEPERPTAVVAAQLTGPVTSLTDEATALSLVDAAHTMVFAVDRRPLAAQAGMIALALNAPLVLLPRSAQAGTAPSEGASNAGSDGASDRPSAAASGGASPAEPTRDLRAQVAADARHRGVVRAIVVGDGATDVAQQAGASDIVEITAKGLPEARPRDVISAAAEDAGTAEADDGNDAAMDQPSAASDDAPTEHASTSPTHAASSAPWPAADGREFAAYRLPPAPRTGAALLVRPRAEEALAAVVTARAAGHRVMATRASDLRADPDVGARLADLADGDDPPPLVLAGDAFADVDPEAVVAHAAVTMTGVELPGGGQLVFDPDDESARRYVGLYGVPQSPALGVLGEQPVPASVERAQQVADDYRAVVDDDVTIIPSFEIIATVASSSAGDDGDYSNELPISDLRPAVDAAGDAGLYVLLDLQPGRTDFLTQAKRYRELLREPHVGLALDPEWRLRPDEKHLAQIGSVGIDEVNEVTDWLADLVADQRLPQKMLLLHQFRTSMIRERERLDTTRDELAFVVQMDGQGPQGTKLETWAAIKVDAPPRVQFGWKNFYDEDTPTRSPADTMALDPPPVFVSYQ